MSKHYSEASAQEMQEREAGHLQAALKDAIDAAYDLGTALINLGKVTGDNPLDWRYGFNAFPRMELRTVLKRLIQDLERVE